MEVGMMSSVAPSIVKGWREPGRKRNKGDSGGGQKLFEVATGVCVNHGGFSSSAGS